PVTRDNRDSIRQPATQDRVNLDQIYHHYKQYSTVLRDRIAWCTAGTAWELAGRSTSVTVLGNLQRHTGRREAIRGIYFWSILTGVKNEERWNCEGIQEWPEP